MIRSLENLIGYRIQAANGDMGTVEDFYFTDDTWRLRYVVVAAGGWLSRRHVLLSDEVISEISDVKREVSVKLTMESVLASPDAESDKPVTRQKEILLAQHFGWKPYWIPAPFLGVALPADRMEIDIELPGADPHLRSFREVTTYEAKGTGVERCVLDMIADFRTGDLLSLVVANGRGRQEESELVPFSKVDRIDWTKKLVLLQETAKAAMSRFNPAAGVNAVRIVEYFDYLGHLHHATLLNEERT
jgi:uncharacterized protein YrrD